MLHRDSEIYCWYCKEIISIFFITLVTAIPTNRNSSIHNFLWKYSIVILTKATINNNNNNHNQNNNNDNNTNTRNNTRNNRIIMLLLLLLFQLLLKSMLWIKFPPTSIHCSQLLFLYNFHIDNLSLSHLYFFSTSNIYHFFPSQVSLLSLWHFRYFTVLLMCSDPLHLGYIHHNILISATSIFFSQVSFNTAASTP